MAETQRILFTCIPNGMTVIGSDEYFKLVVIISPRLTTTTAANDELSFWPDWLDWPATVGGMTWLVDIGTATNLTAVQDLPPGGLRSDLWQALFPSGTFVRGYNFNAMFQNFDDRPIVSYPAAWVNGFLRKQYVLAATSSPESFPPVQSLTGGIGKLGMVVGNSERELLDVLEADLAGQAKTFDPPPVGPTDPGAPDAAAKEFLKAKVMFTPLAPLIPHDEMQAHKEKPDFHDALALLAEHPTLMRMLGLRVDLLVGRPRATPPSDDLVDVQIRWTPSTQVTTVETRPRTHYLFNDAANTFRPKPRTPASATDIVNDGLKLDDPKFDLLQIDTDDAALKARMFADDLQRFHLTPKKLPSTPDERSLPAMHSAGFAVVRSNRALLYHSSFVGQKSLNQTVEANGAPDVFGDHLVWGVRWDVLDVDVGANGQWFSLMRRDAAYDFTRPASPLHLDVVDEEGAVSAAVGQSATGPQGPADDPSRRLILHESIGRFIGWSLVASGPGLGVARDPAAPPEGKDVAPHPDFKLATTLRPRPGSVPVLRFGRRYRMRARIAYLGGAGPPFVPGDTSQDFTHATDEQVYGRFEPVPAPGVLLHDPVTERESVEVMVIRSNFNEASTAPSIRHVAAPMGSYLLGEHHGMFDTPGGLDACVYHLIAERENGSFRFDEPPFPPGYGEDPNAHGQPFFTVNVLQFDFPSTPSSEVPYLADPLARGVSFRGLPTQAVPVVQMDFYEAGLEWPDPRSVRIHLNEGADGFAVAGRKLDVTLGKAEEAEVLLSSYLSGPGVLGTLGVWNWILADAPGSVGTLQPRAVQGRMWMLTPSRTVKMIHAVRQPLALPTFVKPSASKAVGGTVATVRDTIDFHRKSTGSIDIQAEWTDPVDDLTKPAPQDLPRTDKPDHILVDRPGDPAHLNMVFRHEFRNTDHHLVTYRMNGKSRYAEFFTKHTTVDFSGGNDQVIDPLGVAVETEVVREASGPIVFRRGTDYDMDYGQGHIMRKPSGDIGAGETVRVDYVPISVTRLGPPKNVRILNSARPSTPEIAYAVPWFEWQAGRSSSKVTSNRRGQGIRVYLERPWWSSGAEERLGVVMYAGAPPTPVKPYATQWGFDPVYESAPTKATPGFADFPLATRTGTGLSLDELRRPNGTPQYLFSVAGHDVEFDPDRKQWFADLRILAGSLSYFPFVRLGLARYQPYSLLDCHLSRVVRAEFAQLAPDRFATVVYNAVDPRLLTVTVTGRSYKNVRPFSSKLPGPSVVEVRVQVYDPKLGRNANPTLGDELGWVPATSQVVLLPGSPYVVRGIDQGTKWTGRVTLPAPHGTKPFRLLISEYEKLQAFSRRLVYTDTIRV